MDNVGWHNAIISNLIVTSVLIIFVPIIVFLICSKLLLKDRQSSTRAITITVVAMVISLFLVLYLLSFIAFSPASYFTGV